MALQPPIFTAPVSVDPAWNASLPRFARRWLTPAADGANAGPDAGKSLELRTIRRQTGTLRTETERL